MRAFFLGSYDVSCFSHLPGLFGGFPLCDCVSGFWEHVFSSVILISFFLASYLGKSLLCVFSVIRRVRLDLILS